MKITLTPQNFLALCSLLLPVHSFQVLPTSTRSQRGFPSFRQSSSLDMAADMEGVYVMVNGMPGPMATAAAEACLRKGLKLSPFALTGPDMEQATITVVDDKTGSSANVLLVPSSTPDEITAQLAGVREAMQDKDAALLAIDYTHPSAVNGNAKFYVANDIPFVMGTTGGDRAQLMTDVKGHSCVIAPNMGKQIVAMQAALEDLATKYPAAFAGYSLAVTESHQKTKADTSGTAKAVISSLKTLVGDECAFTNDDIDMVRDDDEAIAFGVPEDALTGHAFHTYTLSSADGSVQFQLQHNVAGRTIYAEGTADAVQFLAKKLKTQTEPTVYNMINVLEEGALE
uniref:4-hydroxy-tetrahydrodipicolinate reductase n=1 Tax=Entomoneis paludosa TaxID=265537 RepID=A0A7S3DTU3_9STRA|mmetsp:Transcript_35937/g.74708  ORF Transcript_35937/g.74708 Transcript_35937/m.74708 type:complete len:342 (+) Transcript_35937:52-1077(+)|eukprot:CAMPEP_0172439202 /NCGR_PEP_ID=MMETSP1065-20121228/263_1 /TAXON_ID=265537 /ORGANISM="Amphiprora paludosa, Strain CCMP125" /LENGTH=341 /DNA_ID=CAMNT_0013187851 /DNA_START=47 /DNA_END=1072 /DNA_ORIENTATION=-